MTDSTETPKFGDRITILLNALGLNQREFAETLGLEPSGIAQAKRRGGFSPIVAKAISSVHGVSSEWIQSGKGEIFTPRIPTKELGHENSDSVIILQRQQIEILKGQVEDLRQDKERLQR